MTETMLSPTRSNMHYQPKETNSKESLTARAASRARLTTCHPAVPAFDPGYLATSLRTLATGIQTQTQLNRHATTRAHAYIHIKQNAFLKMLSWHLDRARMYRSCHTAPPPVATPLQALPNSHDAAFTPKAMH